MKIAIISATLPPYLCGVGKYAHCLATALVEQGHQVVVVSLPQEAAIEHVYNLVTVNHFGLSSYWKVAQNLRAEGYTIAHIQYPTKRNKRGVSIVFLPVMLRLLGIKPILTLHEFQGASLLGKVRNFLLLLGVKVVIFPNPADLKLFSWLGKKAKTIPLAPAILADVIPNQKVEPNAVGFMGFMDGSKGEEDLLLAAAKLPKKFKIKFLTTWRGENEHHQHLQRLVDQLGLGTMIQWVNPVTDSDLAAAIQSCQAVVLPFRQGVTDRNSTLFEALSFGKPTIVAVGSDVPTFLKDRENCYMISPKDPTRLAAAIEQVCNSKTLDQKLSKGALASMKDRTWSSIASQTLLVYRS